MFRLNTEVVSGYSVVLTVNGQELACPFKVVEGTKEMLNIRAEPGTDLNEDNNFTMISAPAPRSGLYFVYIIPILNSSSAETFFSDYIESNDPIKLCNSSAPCKEITLSMNFSMETYSVRCNYWNEAEEIWTSAGCKVRRKDSKMATMSV